MASDEAMAAWPAWQRDYTHGTLLLWPPESVRRVVDPLRAAHDPASQSRCGAHITLTQPFARAPSEADLGRVREALAAIPAFTCGFGPLRSFLPAPCLWLEVRPVQRIVALRGALHALGLFRLDLPHTDDFVPHMTITEGSSGTPVTQALFDAIAPTAPTGSFSCTHVAWSVPDDGFRFGVVERFALGPDRGPAEGGEGDR